MVDLSCGERWLEIQQHVADLSNDAKCVQNKNKNIKNIQNHVIHAENEQKRYMDNGHSTLKDIKRKHVFVDA